ncbi:MAG: hypothetical protein K2O54_05470, partial [Prevotella sp.]|nr:hypothetical protein [Prevotella sp.]
MVKIGCVCYSLVETNKLAEQYHLPGVNDFATEILTESLLYYFHFCRILPVLFYFLALYCVMTMRRKGWDEAADVSCGRFGKASRYSFMLLTISGCVLLSSLLVYVFFFLAALPDPQLRTFFLGDLTRLVALYDFLPALFWMLTGALTGFVGSWSAAASVSVTVFFVFNSAFINCLWQISDVTDFFYRVGNLLRFYVPILPVDFYHMFPMGSGCFARVLFWIFLMVALLCVVVRKRLLCGVVPMAAALICLAYYLSPDGMPVYGDFASVHDASNNGTYYYMGREWIEAPADFGIESYVMDLQVGRQLEAEVAVRLTEGSGQREAYRFTLFHGFRLLSVTDQDGQKLDYEWDGDFITVYGEGVMEEIRFVYAGSGKSFYVTEYALYLPSFFPYYPVPGHHMIYDEWDYRALRTEAYYTVRVTADIPVECSLPSDMVYGDEDSDVRVFEGYCYGPALVGSRYLQTYMTAEGIKVVYSGMEYTESEVASICGMRELSPQEYGSSIIASSPLAMAIQTTSYS